MSQEINSTLYALVMAGGKGTRFWPESTSTRPKQYMSLVGGSSLLSQSLKRFEGLIEAKNRYVVTVREQKELALKSGYELMNEDGLIFEPAGRNTAPCILLSLAALEKKGAQDDDVVAIVPSDHVILDTQGFRDTIKAAGIAALKSDSIVTIGIKPTSPHTGFGYIEKAEESGSSTFRVNSFKEKPNLEIATGYVESGDYFWNAGMFVATLKTLKSEFEKCSPDTFKHYPSLLSSLEDENELAKAYAELPEDSIDYAIMEKSSKVSVVEARFDWNDLGSWDALESVMKQENGNTNVASRKLYSEEASGNIVFAPDKHVSIVGLDDLIVVVNEGAVVVMPKSRSQDVKKIVASIKEDSSLGDLL
jgi:mannose-1-phosphate guanylyltransferase